MNTKSSSSNNCSNQSDLGLLLQQSLQNESAGHGTIQAQQTAAQRYKTELCRSFQENGTCKYGEKCQFAHGYHELRSMMRHPKYKSELCRTFHAQGYCPYGPRCHFVHEIKSQPQVIPKPSIEQTRWINTKNSWDNLSAPGSKSVSPKPSESPSSGGLLMCALSGSNSSLFSHDFNDWSNFGSSSDISPTSSRSLSPETTSPKQKVYDDVDFSTTLLVNQILSNINGGW